MAKPVLPLLLVGSALVVVSVIGLLTPVYLGWLLRQGLTSGGVFGRPGESFKDSQERNLKINEHQLAKARKARPLALAGFTLGIALVVASALA